jgi:transcriptional regulator with XRE-family HTH domain
MQRTEISFSGRLKELRGAKTQATIAGELKTNQQTYARWELGDRQPKLQDLASIALHFGVTTDWLLGLSEKENVGSSGSKQIADLKHKLAAANEALEHILQGASKLRNAIKGER